MLPMFLKKVRAWIINSHNIADGGDDNNMFAAEAEYLTP